MEVDFCTETEEGGGATSCFFVGVVDRDTLGERKFRGISYALLVDDTRVLLGVKHTRRSYINMLDRSYDRSCNRIGFIVVFLVRVLVLGAIRARIVIDLSVLSCTMLALMLFHVVLASCGYAHCLTAMRVVGRRSD
jgi:hypothetical protein